MAANPLPDPPAQLKAIQSYMKVASDVERVDPVVAYWVRLFSTETALSIDRETPDCKSFLSTVIVWLEKFKQTHKDNEAVTNQTVGQAHVENFVVAIFNKADTLDRDGTANKNTIRMFYMAAILFEAMAVFGPLTDEISKRAKYAKFKAAYIQKCLKAGQTPKPGPIEGQDLDDPSYSQASGESTSNTTSGNDSSTNEPPKLPDNPADSSRDPFILTPSSLPVYPQAPSARAPMPGTPTQRPITYPSAQTNIKLPPQCPANSNPSSSQSGLSGLSTINATKFHATNGAPLNAEDLIKGQKFCKFANSALQYDDIPTAVANLEKALKLLTTGQNPD